MENLKDKITLVKIGRSGCGKGTQAKLLVDKLDRFGMRHLETGQVLRDLIKKTENPTTARARQILKEGGFVPWWFAVYTWLRVFIEEGAIAHNLIFDGSPRKVLEAGLLDDVLDWHGRPLSICVYINVGYDECKKRLMLRKRVDDNPQAIINRLTAFEADVVPVIKYFQEKGRLLEVNGEQNPEKVQEELVYKLKEKLENLWPIK